jgi:hypothetical protein
MQVLGVPLVDYKDVIDDPFVDEPLDLRGIFGVRASLESFLHVADQRTQLCVLPFVLLQIGIAGQSHAQFFLGAMVPNVILQSVESDLHFYRLNLSADSRFLDGAIQLIEHPQYLLVVGVKVLDANFQIRGPDQLHRRCPLKE